MHAYLLPQLVAVEDAASEAAHISPWWYGGFTMVVLTVLLLVTMILGKGRPHS